MSIIHGGVAPLDMRLYDFGLRAGYFPSDNPTVTGYSASGIATMDPGTLSTKYYNGIFDTSSEANLLANSYLTGLSGHDSSAGLLFDVLFLYPLLLSQVLSDATPPTSTPAFQNGTILQNILDASPIYIYGSGYSDYLKSGSYGDYIEAGVGNDSIESGGGADTLSGENGNDFVAGGDGNDKLYGEDGDDWLSGGGGNDYLNGGGGNDKLGTLHLNGIDYFCSGNDSLDGGAGQDTLDFSLFDSAVVIDLDAGTASGSEVGNDTLAGIEHAIGGAGNDSISGDENANSVSAMNGNDTVSGGLGNDWLHGNIGEDVVYGEDGADSVMGGKGNDSVFGEADNDLVRGGENNDSLFGGDGNDTLLAGKGDDLLSGGAGDDSLDARLGNDTMTGGDGADIFLLASTLNGTTNVDTITDFTPGTDEIWLHPGIFAALAPQYGSHVSLSANLLYDSGTGVLSYDADGAGGGAAVAFANVGPGVSFTGTDFFVGA